jgi:hypothetical protein
LNFHYRWIFSDFYNFFHYRRKSRCYGYSSVVLQKLINVSFANGHIPDSLKIGTLFPVSKNKGDIKSAKNYRGITVTPTFSTIMEKIIKIRENPTIMKIQNPLQRGFYVD